MCPENCSGGRKMIRKWSRHFRRMLRGKHRSIVFDEGDEFMVLQNKQLFQSGLDMVTLAQSNCQQFAYSVWLYGVPLIISTNSWYDVKVSPSDREWLDRNSVVVPVNAPLWTDMEPLQDAPAA